VVARCSKIRSLKGISLLAVAARCGKLRPWWRQVASSGFGSLSSFLMPLSLVRTVCHLRGGPTEIETITFPKATILGRSF
jgi:hypothetical protein